MTSLKPAGHRKRHHEEGRRAHALLPGDLDANKIQVKQAVEKLFQRESSEAVRTANFEGKLRGADVSRAIVRTGRRLT
jgi:ribosomal protein L23